jgi:hypothetical protein
MTAVDVVIVTCGSFGVCVAASCCYSVWFHVFHACCCGGRPQVRPLHVPNRETEGTIHLKVPPHQLILVSAPNDRMELGVRKDVEAWMREKIAATS